MRPPPIRSDAEIPESGVPWWAALLLPGGALAASAVLLLLLAWLCAALGDGDASAAFAALQLDPRAHAGVQVTGFGAVIALGVLALHRGRGGRAALGLRPVPLSALALALAAGLALQPLLCEVSNLVLELHPMSVEEQLMRQRMLTPETAGDAVAIVLGLVLVAPVTEELLFRGLLLPGMARRHGPGQALLLTSLVFGMVHIAPAAMVPAAVAGSVLGAVALRTRSTLPAIALHAGVNLLPILLPERLVAIRGFNTVAADVYHLSPPLLLGALLCALVALWSMIRVTDARTP